MTIKKMSLEKIRKNPFLLRKIKQMTLVGAEEMGSNGDKPCSSWMMDLIKNGGKATALLYVEDNIIKAWAAVRVDSYNSRRIHCAFFVKKQFRRQGIGTKLFLACRQIYPKCKGVFWDPRSECFFDSIEDRFNTSAIMNSCADTYDD